MTLVRWGVVALFLIFFIILFVGMFASFLNDTETFKAIDEKIAKWLRGKDNEETT